MTVRVVRGVKVRGIALWHLLIPRRKRKSKEIRTRRKGLELRKGRMRKKEEINSRRIRAREQINTNLEG